MLSKMMETYLATVLTWRHASKPSRSRAGICVSYDAYRQVRIELDMAFEDTGERNLRNIVRSVRVF